MKVINMLQLPGGQESQQVMLQVRFAEVNRRALTELGVDVVHGAERLQGLGRPLDDAAVRGAGLRHRQATGGLSNKLTFSDFLNLFLFNTKYNVGAVITALKSTGFFQSLAEPNLIAYNNQEASFLAGGEVPVPVVQGGTSSRHGRLQGVRHPADVQADDRGRRHPVEGEAGSQRARFRQRRLAVGVSGAGTDHAPRRDARRAARRPVVRDRRPARQPDAGQRRRRSRS